MGKEPDLLIFSEKWKRCFVSISYNGNYKTYVEIIIQRETKGELFVPIVLYSW